MSLYRRGRVWWIELHHRGRRIRCSAHTENKREAQRKNDELAASLWRERHSGKTFFSALTLWLDARTRSTNEKNAVRQIRESYPDRALSAVTPESFAPIFGSKSAATYNRLMSIVRAALGLAVDHGWIDQAPKFKKRKTDPHRTAFLTAAQWATLKEELPDHLHDMAAFTLETGLRWSNVANLEWSQVNLKRKIAWIYADQAKGGADLSVPLSDAATAILASRRGIHERFVFTYDGRVIRSPKTAWLRATKAAGLDGFRWHDLRHTWASWHVMNGTPLVVLQELGGWSSPEMVRRYAHVARSHAAQFAGNAKPVDIAETRHSKAPQGRKRA